MSRYNFQVETRSRINWCEIFFLFFFRWVDANITPFFSFLFLKSRIKVNRSFRRPTVCVGASHIALRLKVKKSMLFLVRADIKGWHQLVQEIDDNYFSQVCDDIFDSSVMHQLEFCCTQLIIKVRYFFFCLKFNCHRTNFTFYQRYADHRKFPTTLRTEKLISLID